MCAVVDKLRKFNFNWTQNNVGCNKQDSVKVFVFQSCFTYQIVSHLMVYPLVDFLFVVQNDKRLRRDGVAIEDEAQVTTLTLHISEIYEGGVQPT